MQKSDDSVIYTSTRDAESLSMSSLSVVLIGPQEERRLGLARMFAGPQASIAREFHHYPQLDDLGQIADGDYDVLVIDLDPDPERALDVIENICSLSRTLTVMVHSTHTDSELLVRCMRAGAREVLTDPVLPALVAEALVRASVRRDEARHHKKATGRLLVFAGAKGGSGVTTVAANFAVALAKEAGGGKVVLLDLDLQLGDAALTLGVQTRFTAADALENPLRLDSDFLSVLVAKHSSGLSILGAPDTIPAHQPTHKGLDKLLRVARQDFAYVVVDAGLHSIDLYRTLFEQANTVYLVTQVAVSDLRNANRFVSRYLGGGNAQKLEIVLNRYLPRNVEIDDAAIGKALTQPAKWKIPNDYAAARQAQNAGVPIAFEKNHIARTLGEMARAAVGSTALPEKKKKFGLFRSAKNG